MEELREERASRRRWKRRNRDEMVEKAWEKEEVEEGEK